ncbi:hypothetical protein GCM10007414_10220 [Agarivorans gilvus]|uniref:Uncharacterized protein n=1 Tax=Agarivorans gilvus TaxID=680279 RepID=A0ABQ1HZJ1_9ALTE|nr:hypothetical protein GCM10007414_10220 [Agarivorans gilvus]
MLGYKTLSAIKTLLSRTKINRKRSTGPRNTNEQIAKPLATKLSMAAKAAAPPSAAKPLSLLRERCANAVVGR